MCPCSDPGLGGVHVCPCSDPGLGRVHVCPCSEIPQHCFLSCVNVNVDFTLQLFFEGHNMRLAYWNFLKTMTRGKILEFNYDELDKFGTHASTRVREWREKERRAGRDGQKATHTS